MSARENILFRFGVKNTAGECSSIWRVWIDKNDGFLVNSRLANQYKATFHESGLCYVGLTKELRKTLVSDPTRNGQSRFFHKWERETGIRQNQFIHLLDLWFPSSHLDLAVETDRHGKEVIWIEAPASERLVSVGIFIANIADPKNISSCDTDGGLLCCHQFMNGNRFILLYRYIDEPPGLMQLISDHISYALHPHYNEKKYGDVESINTVSPVIRALIWHIVDGSRVWIEASLHRTIGAGINVFSASKT
jgi:hypothetical protein